MRLTEEMGHIMGTLKSQESLLSEKTKVLNTLI